MTSYALLKLFMSSTLQKANEVRYFHETQRHTEDAREGVVKPSFGIGYIIMVTHVQGKLIQAGTVAEES